MVCLQVLRGIYRLFTMRTPFVRPQYAIAMARSNNVQRGTVVGNIRCRYKCVYSLLAWLARDGDTSFNLNVRRCCRTNSQIILTSAITAKQIAQIGLYWRPLKSRKAGKQLSYLNINTKFMGTANNDGQTLYVCDRLISDTAILDNNWANCDLHYCTGYKLKLAVGTQTRIQTLLTIEGKTTKLWFCKRVCAHVS